MPVLSISDSAALIRRTACVLGLLAPATACADGEPVPADGAVVLRDSAGTSGPSAGKVADPASTGARRIS
jgi:hypothetical protein